METQTDEKIAVVMLSASEFSIIKAALARYSKRQIQRLRYADKHNDAIHALDATKRLCKTNELLEEFDLMTNRQ
jgi:hypothetical protein